MTQISDVPHVGDLNIRNQDKAMSNPSVGDAELTLVGKLRQIADAKLGDPIPECLNNTWGTALSQLAGEAADALDQRWRPKETLPQPPAPIGDDKQCRVRVLIQDEADNVFEGYLRYDVDTLLDGKEAYMVRWYTAKHQGCRPKYWMPLPAPCKPAGSSSSNGPRYRAMLTGLHEIGFPAMVVDTTNGQGINGKMCECISFAYAEQIALALNRNAMA
jgi:hypothetical protein